MWLSLKRKKEKILIIHPFEAFLVAQMVKNLLVIQETWVRSLGWKDPVEKGMATHSSILLPGEIHGIFLVGFGPWGHNESDTTEQLMHFHTSISNLNCKLSFMICHNIFIGTRLLSNTLTYACLP